ncbi:SH3 domain-containing protein [Microvirga splendida]|uniref:SH3 domain-containing protein n=1 Tax=Microvirga splendida TaxID=2795727 RepID=A0ABS0XVH2_9HYPH|nr:SH3 domain-containing protein [Microvirga splendida]MBJ6124036.1 SH3 domain-containing protein [Microvirga splendida]
MNSSVGALLLAIAAVGLHQPAWATADGPDFFSVKGVASNDVLFVREKPSVASAKIGQIPPDGRGLRNLECRTFHGGQEVINSDAPLPGTTRWCKIQYQGMAGWVNARFLKADMEAEAQLEQQGKDLSLSDADAPSEGLHGPASGTIRAQMKKSRLSNDYVSVFYGDLTGQGTNDAISLIYSPFEGGNSMELHTWVWREINGTYKLARIVKINELFGESPRNVKFSPGRISVTTTVPKPDDPRCCPTGVKTFTISVR